MTTSENEDAPEERRERLLKESKRSKTGCYIYLGILAVLAVLVMINGGPGILFGSGEPRPPTATPAPTKEYMPLAGSTYAGVKIYYGNGEEKAYGFELLGGAENCEAFASKKGLYVRYPDGNQEWKDREALVYSDLYFVKSDDPKLHDVEWYTYPCP